jgi:hypothetical protein
MAFSNEVNSVFAQPTNYPCVLPLIFKPASQHIGFDRVYILGQDRLGYP